MQFSKAETADVLRCTQRDASFVREIQDNLQTIAKTLGIRSYRRIQAIILPLTEAWYYFMTTLGNLQTLGEEYTGTIRVNNQGQIPSKLVETIWLAFYIGGEPLVDRLMRCLNNVRNSSELTPQAQTFVSKLVDFYGLHKQTLKRLHHALFYINGKYYNISNRVTGIRYVLVRQWLKDDSFAQSFKLLGHLSLFYILFSFVQQIWPSEGSVKVSENRGKVQNLFGKTCPLCSEERQDACATPCGHVFCWKCIFDSLMYQQSCPICREVVFPNRIIFLQNYV